jgi:hypothetical protein
VADDPYPHLSFRPGVDWQGESQGFLARLEQAAAAAGVTLDVFSGRRPASYNSGIQNDPHVRGVAVDAYVGGQPAGQVLSQSLLGRFGLESGNRPGFYKDAADPSGADPSHLQVLNAGVDKTIGLTVAASPSPQPAGWESEVLAGIGAPVNASTRGFLDLWHKYEGGSASFNPLNTTLYEPGATAYNTLPGGGHVYNYPTEPAGVQATVATLKGGGGRYSDVVNALVSGQPFAYTRAGGSSSPVIPELRTWGTTGFADLLAKGYDPGPTVSITDVGANIGAGYGVVGGAVGDALGISTLKQALGFLFSARFLEIVGGVGLIGIGVVGLTRSQPVTKVVANIVDTNERRRGGYRQSTEGTGPGRTRPVTLDADRPAAARPVTSGNDEIPF